MEGSWRVLLHGTAQLYLIRDLFSIFFNKNNVHYGVLRGILGTYINNLERSFGILIYHSVFTKSNV